MKHNQKKIDSALQYLADKHNAEFASEYGEPGYSNPEKGIIFANWNDIPKGLGDWLESCGFELEWSDEWHVSYNYPGGRAYRTSPDSYGWESSIVYDGEGDYLTRDDSHSEIVECIAMTDKGQPAGCVPSWIDSQTLIDECYELINPDLESGFFPGQTDNPDSFARAAFDKGATRVIFRKTENSQFYCRFECWAQFDVPQFDRFDICAAYAQIEADYNIGGMLRERASNIRRNESTSSQLHRMNYRPGANPMNCNAWAIYRALEKRYGFIKGQA